MEGKYQQADRHISRQLSIIRRELEDHNTVNSYIVFIRFIYVMTDTCNNGEERDKLITRDSYIYMTCLCQASNFLFLLFPFPY
jgi:hypothetical protein